MLSGINIGPNLAALGHVAGSAELSEAERKRKKTSSDKDANAISPNESQKMGQEANVAFEEFQREQILKGQQAAG